MRKNLLETRPKTARNSFSRICDEINMINHSSKYIKYYADNTRKKRNYRYKSVGKYNSDKIMFSANPIN